MQPHIFAIKIRKVTERTNYISDTLSTEYTQQTFNHIHYKLWGEITYPFLNFNGCTVEV